MKKFIITYNSESQLFLLHTEDGVLVGQDSNGRELGRDAWREGAHSVKYDYNLCLDEGIPLLPYYRKYSSLR